MVLVLAAVAAACAVAGTASGAPPAQGDWNVTGTESYADQSITLAWASDNSSLGNLTVAPSAVLRFDNVTLFMPVFSVFDIEGSVEVRNSTLYGAGYRILVNGSAVFEDNHIANATLGGTIIQSDSALFVRNTWDCGGSSSGTIHIRRPIDFSHNTMLQACLVDYELAVLETSETIVFSWNTFNDTGGGTQLTFENARHNGTVLVDIQNITVIGGGWSILLGATAPNTSFYIHDSTFINNSLATVRAGDFEGDLRLWNLYYHDIYRAARINGVPGRGVVAHIDNITVTGSTIDSIYAYEATWVIRNSTIGGTATQFEGDTNGHVLVYDTADTPFASTTSGTNGSVEHFALLNIDSLTWQGGVPFTDGWVTFRNATGRNFLNITPSAWAPDYIVWWGMYAGNVRVDNRDLRPSVVDGPHTFSCSPSQFFVSVPMAPTTITCTDDQAPLITVTSAPAPLYVRETVITINGTVGEFGAGLTALTVLTDQGTVDLTAGVDPVTSRWSYTETLTADGTYSFLLSAVDRVGNMVNISHGPVVLDRVVPVLWVDNDTVPIRTTTFQLQGSSEPDATLHVRFSSGWNRTVRLGADGLFAFAVPVADGQNTYLVIVTDRSGNSIEEHHVVVVDRIAPGLSVLLNGVPGLSVYTGANTVEVLVACEGYGVAVGASSRDDINPHLANFQVPLVEGPNRVEVRCTDEAGNQAQLFVDAFLDSTPPVLTASLEGNTPLGDGTYILTSAVAPLLAQAVDGGSGVATFGINGVVFDLLSDGTISESVTLAEGENLIRIFAVDRAGNRVETTVTVDRDTTAPVLGASWESAGQPIVETVGGLVTAGSSANLRVVLSEASSVTIAGVAHDLPAGGSTIMVNLTEGQNRVPIDVEDAAGNAGIGTELAITRDATAPELSVDEPPPGAQLDKSVVTVSGQAEPGSKVLVNGQPVAVGATGAFHATVVLVEGSNTITVGAADAVGNAANTTVTVNYTPASQEPTPVSSGGIELPMLIAGLGLGAAVGAGAMMARKRRPAGASAAESRGLSVSGPQVDAQTPEEPRQGPGPKGPRGPQPPR